MDFYIILKFRALRNTCEDLKVSTLRAVMDISCPVCGLRPRRALFSFTMKLPNPEIFTLSPLARNL